MSLKDRTVVVTGASKGLGLAVVKRLCEEGADIIAYYNSGDITEAQNLAKEAGVKFQAFQADLSKEEVKEDLCGRIPLKSYGNPENIADAVVYFLGERACWTTGTTLPVDGGYLAK